MDCTIWLRLTKTSRTSGLTNEVDVALAVAQFDVGEAVPFFGQRQKVLGEEGELFDVDAELAGACAEEIARAPM